MICISEIHIDMHLRALRMFFFPQLSWKKNKVIVKRKVTLIKPHNTLSESQSHSGNHIWIVVLKQWRQPSVQNAAHLISYFLPDPEKGCLCSCCSVHAALVMEEYVRSGTSSLTKMEMWHKTENTTSRQFLGRKTLSVCSELGLNLDLIYSATSRAHPWPVSGATAGIHYWGIYI